MGSWDHDCRDDDHCTPGPRLNIRATGGSTISNVSVGGSGPPPVEVPVRHLPRLAAHMLNLHRKMRIWGIVWGLTLVSISSLPGAGDTLGKPGLLLIAVLALSGVATCAVLGKRIDEEARRLADVPKDDSIVSRPSRHMPYRSP